MRPLVIYHGPGCPDGFTAAWVADRALRARGLEPELLAAKYGDPPPSVLGREVYVLDFSYPRDVLVRMREEASSLVVLDHHASAAKDLGGLPFCTFDMERSGARLAWDFFFPDEAAPWLVRYVEDRDLWRWKLPGSHEVSAALAAAEQTLDAWGGLDRLLARDRTRDLVVLGGHAILRYQARVVRQHVERAQFGTIAGHTVPIVNATTLVSEIGNELAKTAPFAAMWHDSDGQRHFSLRSSAENPAHVDVSVIAKRFGGGGHKHAAGFTVDATMVELA